MIKIFFKKTKPLRILLALHDRELHRGALSRRLGTSTGSIRASLNMLMEMGLILFYNDKNKKVYYLTEKGRLNALAVIALERISDITDPEQVAQVRKAYYDTIALVARLQSEELFDPAMVETIDPAMPISKKLHMVLSSVAPGISFTLDRLLEEYRRHFPEDEITKRNISTCITRFRNKDNSNYLPNLCNYKNGTYIME